MKSNKHRNYRLTPVKSKYGSNVPAYSYRSPCGTETGIIYGPFGGKHQSTGYSVEITGLIAHGGLKTLAEAKKWARDWVKKDPHEFARRFPKRGVTITKLNAWREPMQKWKTTAGDLLKPPSLIKWKVLK